MNQNTEKPDPKEVDRQLAPRLKMMGYILLGFTVITVGYTFFLPKPPDDGFLTPEEQEVTAGFAIETEEEGTTHPTTPQTYYLFATIFASIGFLCIVAAIRKQAKL